MRAAHLVAVLAASLATAGPALAQRSADQARLMLSIGGGFVGGGDLWRVGNQPISDGAGNLTDTLDLQRRLRSTIGITFSGTYFPGEHLGITGEAFLIGLPTEDGCNVRIATVSRTTSVCNTIRDNERGGSAVGVSGGLVYRVLTRSPIHPYGRLTGGFVVLQQSTLRMSGEIPAGGGQLAEVLVYSDDDPKNLFPFFSVGAGLVAVVGSGYQLRLEARDNYVSITVPSGPTAGEGLKPSTRMRGKHLFSLTIGFDVVLERKRGRRY